ncbi:hypothetical protein LCGC14_0862040 [marine sediment metagenome]|uniref:PD(D/E)XK endonuclease domain-containing protein n=1 Tax=marine sediment metagenome TaxID=412755 RepID=A0A0F9P707_9ZZZZ
MHVNEIGALAEIKVAARLMEQGYIVSKPVFGDARYDLLADNGSIHRVQCKNGRLRNGVVKFKTRSHCAFTGADSPYTSDEIEFFGVYCPELETVYLVPVGDVPQDKGHLRVEPTKNGQVKGITLAASYLL